MHLRTRCCIHVNVLCIVLFLPFKQHLDVDNISSFAMNNYTSKVFPCQLIISTILQELDFRMCLR